MPPRRLTRREPAAPPADAQCACDWCRTRSEARDGLLVLPCTLAYRGARGTALATLVTQTERGEPLARFSDGVETTGIDATTRRAARLLGELPDHTRWAVKLRGKGVARMSQLQLGFAFPSEERAARATGPSTLFCEAALLPRRMAATALALPRAPSPFRPGPFVEARIRWSLSHPFDVSPPELLGLARLHRKLGPLPWGDCTFAVGPERIKLELPVTHVYFLETHQRVVDACEEMHQFSGPPVRPVPYNRNARRLPAPTRAYQLHPYGRLASRYRSADGGARRGDGPSRQAEAGQARAATE